MLLKESDINEMMKSMPEWKLSPDKKSIYRNYEFEDFMKGKSTILI